MKRVILLFSLICLLNSVKGQVFCDTVITFARNNMPVNGTKIKTNLPYSSSALMPTIIIEGFNYGTTQPIGIIINFYIYNGAFSNVQASSFGAYTPQLFLANENGKVVIFMNSKDYYQRFAIRAFAKGMSQDIAANYQGWSVVDEAISTTALNQTEITYLNKFAGTVVLPGNGIWQPSGRVGVNVTSPQAPLHVIATAKDTVAGYKLAAILGNAYNEWTAFGAATGGKIRGSSEGYLVLETNTSGSNNRMYLNSSSAGNIIMAVGGGNVGIGTVEPKGNKLAVEGTIAARRVKVTQANPWPDYVFGDNYVLMPLSETEKFIKEHKHLPEIPSAKEVAENGQDLGEMNRKLLEKMEEMTLHMIRMQKQIDRLKSQIKKQQ